MDAGILVAILLLAAVDSLNPTSIAGAIYLGGLGQVARLRLFIVAVYSTYLLFGLALMFGPAAALRSALADTPSMFGPAVEVAVGGLLIGIGVRTWRERSAGRVPRRAAIASPGSGLALGVISTLADLPTAAPLLAATTLLAGAKATASVQLADLGLYNFVYISPLLAVAIAHRQAARTGGPTTEREPPCVPGHAWWH